MVVIDGLLSTWHQGICNNHEAGRCCPNDDSEIETDFFFRKPRDVHQLYTDDYLLAYQHFTEMKEMTGAP